MSDTLHILHIALLPSWSAQAWHTVTVAKALRNRGHTCWIAGRRNTPLLPHAVREGMPVADDLLLPDLRPWNWFQSVGAVRRFLKRHAIDVIFVHTGSGHVEAHLARRPLPIALVRVRAESRAPRIDGGHRWLYQHGAERIAVSASFIREQHLAPLHLGRDRVAVLAPAIDVEQVARGAEIERASARAEIRKRYAVPPRVPLIGQIGRVSVARGQLVLIEAAGKLAAEGREFRLLIAGEEGDVSAADLRMAAESCGVLPRLIIAGRVSDPMVHAAAFDIGVIPSVGSEAISRHTLELMAVGIPIVASMVGTLPDLIPEDELLVPPERPAPLAAALGRLLDDPVWAGRLGERLYERVLHEYSIETLGERAEALAREAIAIRRAAQRRWRPAQKRNEDEATAAAVGDYRRAK